MQLARYPCPFLFPHGLQVCRKGRAIALVISVTPLCALVSFLPALPWPSYACPPPRVFFEHFRSAPSRRADQDVAVVLNDVDDFRCLTFVQGIGANGFDTRFAGGSIQRRFIIGEISPGVFFSHK